MTAILETAGFAVDLVERDDDALAQAIEQVEVRLRALRLVDLPLLRPFNLRRGIDLALQGGRGRRPRRRRLRAHPRHPTVTPAASAKAQASRAGRARRPPISMKNWAAACCIATDHVG